MGGMSRLRRLVVSDRWFFVTCRLLPRPRILSELEFAAQVARVFHALEAWRREPAVVPTDFDGCHLAGLASRGSA